MIGPIAPPVIKKQKNRRYNAGRGRVSTNQLKMPVAVDQYDAASDKNRFAAKAIGRASPRAGLPKIIASANVDSTAPAADLLRP